ncbi:MAG: type II toxin-antitoxin system RelE/ParE family toxin [Nitrospira sp.]|nr:type II toxin-antitoxin system RelE/ParE family toxin [Nitrospira sp.]
MIIEYHPAIEQELREIRDYYEARSPGLGYRFLDEFERQVLRIAAAPLQWTVVERDLRRSLMKRFPYIIYFRIVGQDVLRITVVKHQRRHPDLGRERE